MKIALINPPARREYDRHWARFPVLGLAYVAAALRAAGHEVRLFDGKLADLSIAAIRDGVRAFAPELTGITCMTVEFPQVAQLAELLKTDSASPIIAGGAHINAVGVLALEECPFLDFLCIDEGEYLVRELAEALENGGNLASITGLVWRNGSGIVANPRRPYPEDYDALPFPAWDLFNVAEQIPILTHRGCPFQCNFCGHNSGFRPRYRSPENVLAELEHLVEHHQPRVIRFEDETFGLNVWRTKQILKGILERGLERKVMFSAQTRVDKIDLEFVHLLKECRFETLELGVESGNPGVLERTRKGITLEQVERAVALAKVEGLKVWCKFILGHPDETRREVLDTAAFIARLNPDRLSVSIMTPFPGTPIYDLAVRGEGGYRLLGREWERFDKYASGVLELEHLGQGELKLHQILCYARMYVQNRRIGDLLGIVRGHRRMAMEMLVDTGASLWRGRARMAASLVSG